MTNSCRSVPDYFSILVCDRGQVVELYSNGLPLARILNGQVHLDPLFDVRNPCLSKAKLQDYLLNLAAKLD